MSQISDTTIGTAATWLQRLSQRQQATSNNIANIDTPGYKRQTVNFETELKRAVSRGASSLVTTDPRHIALSTPLRSGLGIDPTQLLTSSRLDGNNVDIDSEMLNLADTQMRYTAASNVISSKLKTLRTVISG